MTKEKTVGITYSTGEFEAFYASFVNSVGHQLIDAATKNTGFTTPFHVVSDLSEEYCLVGEYVVGPNDIPPAQEIARMMNMTETSGHKGEVVSTTPKRGSSKWFICPRSYMDRPERWNGGFVFVCDASRPLLPRILGKELYV